LVQSFFQHLIESRALGTIDQAKGRFRSFLLASFQNFISMERRRAGAEKRSGRAELIRMDWQDAESRIAFEPEDRLTPKAVYDARWALELLGRATRRLEKEQAALGKAQAFRTLRPFLGDEGARASLGYEAAAQALNLGLPALKTLIHRFGVGTRNSCARKSPRLSSIPMTSTLRCMRFARPWCKPEDGCRCSVDYGKP
jgi:hypothetical protein